MPRRRLPRRQDEPVFHDQPCKINHLRDLSTGLSWDRLLEVLIPLAIPAQSSLPKHAANRQSCKHALNTARAMAEIHRLLEQHGKQAVLSFDVDRRVVEAAAGYLSAEEGEVGFLYSGWAQSALPHKRLSDNASWQVHTDHVSLVVQPGLRPSLTGDAVSIGVPYGSRARLIILYLQSEALKTNSREVELGKTLMRG